MRVFDELELGLLHSVSPAGPDAHDSRVAARPVLVLRGDVPEQVPDGVVHGAGVIEDKLLTDKTWESFARVFETKVESAFSLTRRLRAETLKFLVLLSSVAGRFGNRGQCDYTAANDVLNKLAVYLNQRWAGRVCSMNWGPWEIGLASPEVQRQFTARGVALISPSAGVTAFRMEILKGHKREVEVIIGDGPWKEFSVSHEHYAYSDESVGSLPLFDKTTVLRKNHGFLEMVKCLDPAQDIYLQDHRLDGKPVLPAAMAIELMAEAAHIGWPGWNITAVNDVRVLKGIVLNGDSHDVRVLVRPKVDTALKAETISIEVSITDNQHLEMIFYRATVVLSQAHRPLQPREVPIDVGMKRFWMSEEEAYKKLLFHGPRFQCIKNIEGISKQGILATLVPSLPGKCLASETAGHWLIDPIVLDGGLQLVLIWTRTYLDMTALPSSFKAVRIFKPFHLCPLIRCYVEVLEETGNQNVYSNLFFMDQEGHLLGMIEGLESTGNKALNRLAGTHSCRQMT